MISFKFDPATSLFKYINAPWLLQLEAFSGFFIEVGMKFYLKIRRGG